MIPLLTSLSFARPAAPRRGAALAACCATGLFVAGCANSEERDPLAAAIAVNESRHVATAFEEHPVVLDDEKGLTSLRYFFPNSETLVLSDASVEAQLRAASIAVAAHAPMLVYDPARRQEILTEIERLKTYTVLTVGDVALARASGRVRVYRDPGGLGALGEMTAVRFTDQPVDAPADAATAVAQLDPQHPAWLHATWADPVVLPGAVARPFPIMSRRDAQMAPVVVATPESSIASVANARSFGARVTMVDDPDPRNSDQTLFAMAGLAQLPMVALGSQFGDENELPEKIMQAQEYYFAQEGDNAKRRG